MTWIPPEYISLAPYKRVVLDTETKGLSVWTGGFPIGCAVGVENKSLYYSFAHLGQGERSKLQFKDWAQRELRGKELIFHNARFDLMMLEESLGLNLRDYNTIRDTMHMASLLDNQQKGGYSLDNTAKTYIGEMKLKVPFHKEDLWMQPPEEVGPYAERDAELTYRLFQVLEIDIANRGLQDVYNLESEVIKVVVEMERNGLPIDEPKLMQWLGEVNQEYLRVSSRLGNIAPNKGIDIKKEFDAKGIKYLYNLYCPNCEHDQVGLVTAECNHCSKTGMIVKSPSFAEASLEYSHNPLADDILLARKLDKLLNYLRSWRQQGKIVRFELHQLRGDEFGTISGRFSSSSPVPGPQPQQIWKPSKQKAAIGDKWILRELFIPFEGETFFKSDASQIEYRLFSHYVGHYNPNSFVLQSYQANPRTDFHQLIYDWCYKGIADLSWMSREDAKNCSFRKIYGGGARKLAMMLGISTALATRLDGIYESKIPEAKDLIRKTADVAKKRGFVKTVYGRQSKIDPQYAYTALNRIIQGSAADVMKERLVAVYKERKRWDLRMLLTLHDELLGSLDNGTAGKEINDVLESFTGPTGFSGLRIPLLWDYEIGPNWAMRG